MPLVQAWRDKSRETCVPQAPHHFYAQSSGLMTITPPEQAAIAWSRKKTQRGQATCLRPPSQDMAEPEHKPRCLRSHYSFLPKPHLESGSLRPRFKRRAENKQINKMHRLSWATHGLVQEPVTMGHCSARPSIATAISCLVASKRPCPDSARARGHLTPSRRSVDPGGPWLPLRHAGWKGYFTPLPSPSPSRGKCSSHGQGQPAKGTAPLESQREVSLLLQRR
jgi:hypothetical protein